MNSQVFIISKGVNFNPFNLQMGQFGLCFNSFEQEPFLIAKKGTGQMGQLVVVLVNNLNGQKVFCQSSLSGTFWSCTKNDSY